MAEKPLANVRIVGAGLIGTSIALALRAGGVNVLLSDSDPRAQRLAQDLMGQTNESNGVVEDLCIVATPPESIAEVVSTELKRNPALRVMDISSIKSKPVLDISTSELALERFAPTHPMAGREISGPESARGDLFQGRPWILCLDGVEAELAAMVEQVVALCGANPIRRTIQEHDRAVALVSHLPQIVASLLAAQLQGAEPLDLELAGAGLRDTTRIADSDPELWAQIIAGNSQALRPLLINLQSDLSQAIESLDHSISMASLVESGRRGRAAIPGKHGGKARNYTYLAIVIEDKPGQLAAIIESCARAKVNIEDLAIEHTPGQETGLITLAFSPEDSVIVAAHLDKEGWKVHPSR
jgi:prephenate dehydrogenase